MTAPVELRYRPGSAAEFIQELWRHVPAAPEGALVGVVHIHGDRGQIQIRVADVQVRQLVLLPGQILRVVDPTGPNTWSVTDGPHPPTLLPPR